VRPAVLEVKQPEQAQPTAGTVVDLMAALRASVEAAKAGRPGGGEPYADKPSQAAAKKSSAKSGKTGKTPAKQASESVKPAPKAAKANKKTAPKKVAARKSA